MGLAWSPDGTKIAAVGANPGNENHLMVFDVANPGVVDLTDAVGATPAGAGKLYTVQP